MAYHTTRGYSYDDRLGTTDPAYIEVERLIRFFASILFFSIGNLSYAQRTIVVLDSLSQKPIIGVAISDLVSNTVLMTDIEGKAYIPILDSSHTILLSMLGYEKKIIPFSAIPSTIYLSPRSYTLRQLVVQPISARGYIERAFDSFQKNYFPFSFVQRCFYREEFIINEQYLRFQEMDMNIYQFPKSGDARKYYISGSYPEVKQLYRMDNVQKMTDIKKSIGKIFGKYLNINQFTTYSYVKGSNILNFLFTNVLADPNALFKIVGEDIVSGYSAVHIRGEHYLKGRLVYHSDIFIEPESMAILHFSVLATDENIVKHLLDFKSKFALWIMGIRINVSKFYLKVQFEKNPKNLWTVRDFTMLCPLRFHKKETLDCYLAMNCRMDSKISPSTIPVGAKLYGQNEYLFNHYSPSPRFAPSVPFAIPLVPIQQNRLKKLISR